MCVCVGVLAELLREVSLRISKKYVYSISFLRARFLFDQSVVFCAAESHQLKGSLRNDLGQKVHPTTKYGLELICIYILLVRRYY